MIYNLRFIMGGKPTKKLKDFLIKFSVKDEDFNPETDKDLEEKPSDSDLRKEVSNAIRSSLFRALGMNKEGKFEKGKLKTRQPPEIPSNKTGRNNPVIVKNKKDGK